MGQMPVVRKREAGDEESAEVLRDIDLLARDNPRSVINLVPPQVQAHIFSALKARPDLFRMGERQLRKAVKPSPTDSQLRLAFWNEYNLAQAHGTPMRMASVYAGICTLQFFYHYYLNETVNIAWMLCPPSSYIVSLEEILNRSHDKLSEFLDVDIMEDGKPNLKLVELILKIHVATEARLKGAVVVRTEARNLNLHANVPITPEQAQAAVNKLVSEGSLTEVEEKVERLRKEQAREARRLAGQTPE